MRIYELSMSRKKPHLENPVNITNIMESPNILRHGPFDHTETSSL